jgi:hypothetical protein
MWAIGVLLYELITLTPLFPPVVTVSLIRTFNQNLLRHIVTLVIARDQRSLCTS